MVYTMVNMHFFFLACFILFLVYFLIYGIFKEKKVVCVH